jgi:hypothetical protein
VSITQVIQEHEIEKEYEQMVQEEGASVYQKEMQMDPK